MKTKIVLKKSLYHSGYTTARISELAIQIQVPLPSQNVYWVIAQDAFLLACTFNLQTKSDTLEFVVVVFL